MHPSDLPKQAAIIICNEKMNDVFLYMVKLSHMKNLVY